MTEEKITILKNESKEIKADKTKLKEQIQIQEDRSRRKNIQVDIIEEMKVGCDLTARPNLNLFCTTNLTFWVIFVLREPTE